MKRRGNKSSKVPNVKLRPPQPGDFSTRETESICWAQDSQQFNDAGESIVDLCPRPFKGVVVCATGIVDKPTLFKQAVELGAMSVDAFTDRATHLIAINHGSAKYKCALERKIPILQPSWITESYQIWLRGDDVDIDESLKKHRLPIFAGVTLTLSGMVDIARRTQINKLVTQQQGVYVKNLERPVKVTHLLCSGDEETEKMRYAEKFNKKGEARIHLIWEEWFWDSIEFGGRFDEDMYQVRQPRPVRKSIPEANLHPPSEALLSESDPPTPLDLAASQGQEEPEEVAAIKRVPAVTLQVWESLLKPRGFEISSGKLVRSPSKSQRLHQPPSQPSPTKVAPNAVAGGSIISAFRRANSFAPQQNEASGSRQPFRRTSTLLALPSAPRAEGAVNVNNVASSAASVSCCPSLFTGLKFRTIGEAKCPNVHSAIEGSSGVLVSEGTVDDDVDYVIVRLVSGSKFFRQEPEECERRKYRTECWLERCIYEERICSGDEHISFIPLKIEIPVTGAEKVNLSISGFDESESWALRRLIRALGVDQAPNFSRRSTHLLCPSGTGAKFEKAQEWGIPIVNMQWLVDMARVGVVFPVAEYLVGGNFSGNGLNPAGLETGSRGQEKTDAYMHEITNNAGPNRSRSASHPAESLERKKPPEGNDYTFFGDDTGLLGSFPPLQNLSTPCSAVPPETRTQSPLEYVTGSEASLPSIHLLENVPSSMSPSPMKMAESQQGEGEKPASPAKLSTEVTRALQDSITSLLGKRPVCEEGTVPGRAGRGGKRVRPHSKSKMQSRNASKEVLQDQGETMTSRLSQSIPGQFESFDGPIVGNKDLNLTEESMRVTYEDPGERDEKKRLMSLFENQAEAPVEQGEMVGKAGGRKKPKGMVRRSMRVAGF